MAPLLLMLSFVQMVAACTEEQSLLSRECRRGGERLSVLGVMAGRAKMGDVFRVLGPATSSSAGAEVVGSFACYRVDRAGKPLFVSLHAGMTGDGTVIEKIVVSSNTPAGVSAGRCVLARPGAPALGSWANFLGLSEKELKARLGEPSATTAELISYVMEWTRPASTQYDSPGRERPLANGDQLVYGQCGVEFRMQEGRARDVVVLWREST